MTKNLSFKKGLEKLGFYSSDDSLYLVNDKEYNDPQIAFLIEKASQFSASAIYLRKQLNGSYKPQAYLYDYTGRGFQENELTEIQKKIWSSGEAPLACIFYNTEIKILDCTTHINENNTPVYLYKSLQTAEKAHKLYNSEFAIKIKSGIFWEEEENRKKFKFQNSSYDKLINNIRYIIESLKKQNPKASDEFVNKIIVQSILIKYLEERIDDDGNKLLSNKFFKKYDNSQVFNDVLVKGKFVELLTDLNDSKVGFNGNVFEWTDDEKKQLKKVELSNLAELLESRSTLQTKQMELWRYFEFKYIPVELISRLYEEFLGKDKRDKGLYYTPSHLAKLLVDEALPLKSYKQIDLNDYSILDPACGSGIFLVIAFKRLVQIWRLQNEMAHPELANLKKILRNIWGIDKEEQAVRLASFSLCLALCNELKPIDIIKNLKFDDLRKSNIIQSDFFVDHSLSQKKFDLIIGNPPFNRGAISEYSEYWEYKDEKVKIPQGQIALKFLCEGTKNLKEKGLLCLIIKASGLLYNTTSGPYKKLLFSNFNIVQVLDFTALARNKALWDNEADVACAAIFLKNEKPNFEKNILHLTFKRTKATRERIAFEIDDYDLHFITRQSAIDNYSVWKNNLLGGGRIRALVDKFSEHQNVQEYFDNNSLVAAEGFIIGAAGSAVKPAHIFNVPTLPTEAITENGIDYSLLMPIKKNLKFKNVPDESVFKGPNVLIWENIGEKKLPVFFNQRAFSFRAAIIGVVSKKKDKNLLLSIVKSFSDFSDFYRFLIFATSSQVLINKNTALLKTDIMQLPYIENNQVKLSNIDKNVIADVNEYMQDFLRTGENSKALYPIGDSQFKSSISNYADEFIGILNNVYKNKNKQFRLSDAVLMGSSFIAVVFKYDNKTDDAVFHSSADSIDIEELTNNKISKYLSINRIIKLYPKQDTIVFVKPNQKRYWLSLTAYRDADKCSNDLSKLGY